MTGIRTDLAQEAHQLHRDVEGVECRDETCHGYEAHVVQVRTPKAAQALGKPVGTYVTLELDGLARREEDAFGRAARALAAELGCAVAEDNRVAAAQAEYVFLCVKPQMMEGVLSELVPALGDGQAVVSIAAGLTCETLRGWLAVAAIVVLGSVVSFSLIMQSIVDIGPSKSSMLASSEPLSATVFSVLWLGTSFSGTDLIGFAAIISTIFLLFKSS